VTRPVEWLLAVRDHPQRPPPAQRLVLEAIALRLNWSSGTGFASVEQLMADADASRSTVIRALQWARGDGAKLLDQTRRGGRLGNGKIAASEWRLLAPSQGVTRDTLRPASRGQKRDLKVSAETSQGVTGDTPSRPSPSRPSTSSLSRLRERAAEQTGATEREIELIIKDLRRDPRVRYWPAIFKRELDDGVLADRLERLRQEQARAETREWCGSEYGDGFHAWGTDADTTRYPGAHNEGLDRW
jgi:hypothetical protein